jgi:hypothetical protein
VVVGDKAEDYDFVPWGSSDKELQTYGDVFRTVYTGYKPYIPLTQTYNMHIKSEAASNAVKQKKGFFQFQPEGSGITAWGKNVDKEWGGLPDGGDLSNVAAYSIAREILEQTGLSGKLSALDKNLPAVASDMQVAGKGATASSAGKRAVALAKELETIIKLKIPQGADEKVIKGGESLGEIRTQGMVQFLMTNKGLTGESAFLNKELREMQKILQSHKITDEQAGGFSTKGFDIGHYSEQDAQTLSYLTQRFRDEFDIEDYKKIVGMEETNLGGKKLFQKIGKQDRIYQVQKGTVQKDLQKEMDMILGSVESFIQRVANENLSFKEMKKIEQEMMDTQLQGGNEFLLDSPVTLTQEMWNEMRSGIGSQDHESLTSFSAQVVDRLYRAYNTNVARGLDGEENSGYFYIVPVKIKYPEIKSPKYSLVGVHIFGDFQKTAQGVELTDIQNKVYNLGIFETADQVALDTWMQRDLQMNGNLSNSTFQRAAQDYRQFIGREMQMFYGSFEAIGAQLLLSSKTGDAFQTQINFVSTMTSADMAKSFQDQIEAQLSSGAVSQEFKAFYDKMTKGADDLTKSWKAAVGANVVQDLSKVLAQKPEEGAFAGGNTFGIRSDFVWPDHKGIGNSGGFTNRQSGAMEGFAFTPFVDSTKEDYYIHSKGSVFPTVVKGIKPQIKKIIERRKLDEKMGRREMMDQDRLGGPKQKPVLRILWQNGKLKDGLEEKRQHLIDTAMRHLQEAGLI